MWLLRQIVRVIDAVSGKDKISRDSSISLAMTKGKKTKCRMSILTIRHPALQSMCSKD